MPWYRVPVFWEVGGYIIVEAENEDDAGDYCFEPETPLPEDILYVDGSLYADYEMIVEVDGPEHVEEN